TERARGAIADGGGRQLAADRGAAHAADDEPARQVARARDSSRLDPPEGVAELERLRQDVAEHSRGVGGLDRIARQRVAFAGRRPLRRLGHASTLVPAGIRVPSSMLAPGSTRASSPSTAPAPTSARLPT